MLWQEGFVVDVVDHRDTNGSLGVYQKEVTDGNTISGPPSLPSMQRRVPSGHRPKS